MQRNYFDADTEVLPARMSMLRDYQCEIIDNFDRRVAGDPRSPLIATPSGGGKAVLVTSGVLADFVRALSGDRVPAPPAGDRGRQ
jgi:hypothetical protein